MRLSEDVLPRHWLTSDRSEILSHLCARGLDSRSIHPQISPSDRGICFLCSLVSDDRGGRDHGSRAKPTRVTD